MNNNFDLKKHFKNRYLKDAGLLTEAEQTKTKTNNFELGRLYKVLDKQYELVQRKVSTKYEEEVYDKLVKGFIDHIIEFDINYNFTLMDPGEISDLFVDWLQDNKYDNQPDTEEDNGEVDYEALKKATTLEKEYDEVITEIANKVRQNYGK